MKLTVSVRVLSWIFVLLIARPTVGAQGGSCVPPPNEDCSGAVVVTTADLPFDATAPLGCTNDVVDKPYFDAFYRFDATVSGTHLIHMCDSVGDTYLRVYGDGCGWTTGFELATADDECPGSPPNADPLLMIDLEAGQSYWIEVGTWRPDPPFAPPPNAPYTLHIELVGQPSAISCDGTGITTALIASPGNTADTNGLGSVDDLFRMTRFEITNRQYVDFLNAVAATDPNALYSEDMTDSDRGGILRGGSTGSFTYFVKESFGDKPVNFVSWTDAARFANWLHNGRPIGAQGQSTTESGAYDLSVALGQIVRDAGARFYLPDHDQWYKAAYFDPVDEGADASGTPDYWLYPTASDSGPTQATADVVGDVSNPGTNVANWGGGADWNGENGNVTTIGGTTTENLWHMADMGGNVLEMTETPDTPIPPDTPTRTARGGDLASPQIIMSSPDGFGLRTGMTVEAANLGFRLAATTCRGDLDGDNDIDNGDRTIFEGCFTGPGGGPVDPLCALGDFDQDTDVDCDDFDQLALVWTALAGPEPLLACILVFSDGFESGDTSAWSQAQ